MSAMECTPDDRSATEEKELTREAAEDVRANDEEELAGDAAESAGADVGEAAESAGADAGEELTGEAAEEAGGPCGSGGSKAAKRPRYNDAESTGADAGEELTGEAAQKAGGPRGKHRPRYNDKSFGDLTVNDIEGIVREVNMLRKQCTAKDEEIATLREVRTEKAALAKQLRALQAEAAGSRKETERCKTAIKEQDEDVATQASRLKKALKQTLSLQMVYAPAFKEQLSKEGREIVAFAANVSPELAKALSAEAGSKNKYSDTFFGEQVTKTSKDCKLVMVRMMSVKYFKTTCELRVDASYVLEGGKKSG